MRKLLLLFLVGTAQVFCCHAQSFRTWAEGFYDWTGFRVESELEESSRAAFTLLPQKRTVSRDGLFYHYTDVTSAILPEQSVVRRDCVTEDEMVRIQQEFDLLEYFARALREEWLFSQDEGLEAEYISRFQETRKLFRAGEDVSAYALVGEPFDITKVRYSAARSGHAIYFGPAVDFPLGGKA